MLAMTIGASMTDRDIAAIVAIHRDNPRRFPAYAATLCMLIHRDQAGAPEPTPNELADLFGCTYMAAWRTLKDAREGMHLYRNGIDRDGIGAFDGIDHNGIDRGCTYTETVYAPIPKRSTPPDPPNKDLEEEEEEEDAPTTGTPPDRLTSDRPDRPIKADPTEARRIAKWADSLPGAEMEELGSKVGQFKTSYPLDWIEAAILCGYSSARPGARWQYAHKCLLSWWSKGRPNHAEIDAAREAAGPTPGASQLRYPAYPQRETIAEARRRKAEAFRTMKFEEPDRGR